MGNQPPQITISTKREQELRYQQDLADAHASRGTLEVPMVIPLPGGKVAVIRNFPGQSELDVDPDSFR